MVVGRVRQLATTVGGLAGVSKRNTTPGAENGGNSTVPELCWSTRKSVSSSLVIGSMSTAVLRPVIKGVSLPIVGSICSTDDVPGGNGKPLKSVTRRLSLETAIPVGTASSVGPPTLGKAGFGMPGNDTSSANAPV